MQDGVVRVELVGTLTVTGDITEPLPGGRARSLLGMLAVRHGRFVPAATLADRLWPAEPPSLPLRNLAALVSRLRRSIGRDRVEGGPRAYRLVLDPWTTVDLSEAVALVGMAENELAQGRPGLALRNSGRGVALLDAGIALADEPDGLWVDGVRNEVATLLARARRCRWAAALTVGDHETALAESTRALAVDPLDEDAARATMRAHEARSAPADALAAYERLRRELTTRLGVDPSTESEQLYLRILRGTTGPAPAARTSSTAAPVGREREHAVLEQMWDDAVRGRGRLAVLRGEPGIGKSTLATEIGHRAERSGGVTVHVRCAEAERSLYLQPFAEVVRDLLVHGDPDDAGRLPPSDRAALATLVPELDRGRATADVSELRHRRTVDALAGLLHRVAEEHPLMIGIDDIENAGQSTIEVLHYLAGRLADSATLIVVTENDTEDHRATSTVEDVARIVDVGPLSREAVQTLLTRAGSRHDPEHFFTWTGGSPLLISELLRHPPPDGERLDAAPVPATLHDALVHRLESTTEDVRDLLAQASVLGRSFSVDDVAALTGIPIEVCAQRCERAQRAGLVGASQDGGEFRFASEILRRTVYAESPRPVRVSRHRRAAALHPDRPEAAAGHLTAAGDHLGAARAWLHAADVAHLVFAHVESERMLTHAVEQAELGADPVLAAQARLRRGAVRCDLARHDDARHDHEHALAVARELADEQLEARAVEALGWTALHARDALTAVDLAEQAGHLAESAAAAPGAQRSSILLLGRVRHWDGDYRGAERAYDDVLALGTGDALSATATAYRGALLQHLDRFDEARSTLERAVELSTSTGEFRTLLQSLFFCALSRGDMGDFAGALRALRRARRLIDEAGVDYYRAGIETTTSWLFQELGQIDRAREHAEQAVDLARRGGGALELEQELHALLALADCDLLDGREDDAGRRVDEAAPLLSLPLPYRPRAEMRLLQMQARWDLDPAERLLDHARRFRSAKYEALALARLGRPAEAFAAAGRTGSDLVVALVGPDAVRTGALDRIRAGLPPDLRSDFASRGKLVRPAPVPR